MPLNADTEAGTNFFCAHAGKASHNSTADKSQVMQIGCFIYVFNSNPKFQERQPFPCNGGVTKLAPHVALRKIC
jgi:hypothetical protein